MQGFETRWGIEFREEKVARGKEVGGMMFTVYNIFFQVHKERKKIEIKMVRARFGSFGPEKTAVCISGGN